MARGIKCYPFQSFPHSRFIPLIISDIHGHFQIKFSDAENSRSAWLDWHNFIRTGIKYEILLHILLFGLALFFKYLILTCLFKKISTSLKIWYIGLTREYAGQVRFWFQSSNFWQSCAPWTWKIPMISSSYIFYWNLECRCITKIMLVKLKFGSHQIIFGRFMSLDLKKGATMS